MVKHLAFWLALLTSTAAHAQAQRVFRCVDASGGTYYTEKPAAGCKPTRIESGPAAEPAPQAPATKADMRAAKPQAKLSAAAPLTAKAHCDGLANETARLNSANTSPAAEARLAGIEKALARSCR